MTEAVETQPVTRPRALDAGTMCEAFQLTAAERPDQAALRTIGDGISITFREYADRVRRLAGGLYALGVRRGDTVACMLTNRPEFHLLDTAAMHLGATPFSIYNTSPAEQIAYLLSDAGNRVLIAESGIPRPGPGGDRADRHGRAPDRPRRPARGRDHARRARGRAAGRRL